jgi:starvation-inducible DNA-binding protein
MDKYHLALKTAFASEYAFYLKAQNFHWNVEGMFFEQFHALFGGIYEEVGDIIDAFAENLRKSKTYAPASFARFSMLSEVADEVSILDAKAMCAELLADSEKMEEIFKITYKMAEAQGNYGLANFLADRQDAHAKHSWMLRATLK